jgi:hypothetical protein
VEWKIPIVECGVNVILGNQKYFCRFLFSHHLGVSKFPKKLNSIERDHMNQVKKIMLFP